MLSITSFNHKSHNLKSVLLRRKKVTIKTNIYIIFFFTTVAIPCVHRRGHPHAGNINMSWKDVRQKLKDNIAEDLWGVKLQQQRRGEKNKHQNK